MNFKVNYFRHYVLDEQVERALSQVRGSTIFCGKFVTKSLFAKALKSLRQAKSPTDFSLDCTKDFNSSLSKLMVEDSVLTNVLWISLLPLSAC